MKPGAIRKIFNYYYHNPAYQSQLEKALRDFFNIGSKTAFFAADEAAKPYFNEWLTYDFKLANGKTLLEDFYERNPYNLSPIERQAYKDLMTNEYGAFEVLKVEQGQGLELLSLQTAKKYYVNEFRATFQLKPGAVIFNRVAKTGDHYELVGADSIVFDVQLEQGAKDYLLASKDKLTPRDAFRLIASPPGKTQPRPETKKLTKGQIKKELDLILAKIDLNNYVSAASIEKWISRLDYEKEELPANTAVSMLFGLLKEHENQETINRLVGLIGQLANLTPQKALNGKSPHELASVKGHEPKFKMNVTTLNTGNCIQHYEKAMAAMKKRDSKKALKEYETCFSALLKERTTLPEVYRLFANTALMNFSEGNEYEGLKLLALALELNPNYDFGLNVRKKYEQGLYDNDLMAGRLKNLANIFRRRKERSDAKRFQNNPANLYYQYLKKFKINFKTDTLTKSTITEIDPDGRVRIIPPKAELLTVNKIGRNQPCPCGAKKPDGAPLKHKHCCGS